MWAGEILQRWVSLLPWALPIALVGAGLAVGAVALRRRRAVGLGLLGLAVLIGAAELWRRLSLVDDAFISFRYVRNLLDGHGLVYNPGEPVLGITNLGWTLLLAAVSAIGGIEAPYAALICGPLAWLLLIAATWRVSQALRGDAVFPPLAAALVAVSWPVCSFGSTGLETVFATALVILGLDGIVRGQFGRAGFALTLAAIVRLDHGLFLAVGGLLALRQRQVVPFVASAPLLALVLGWTWWVTGEPLPNTVHAKAGGAYWSQGGIYLLASWLATHLFGLSPLALIGALARGTPRDLRDFTLGSLVVWNAYVAYVGGDFMVVRFLLPCVPLVLLAAEQAVAAAPRRRALGYAAWLGACAYGVPIVTPQRVEWHLADEGTVYPAVSIVPLEIDHRSFVTGNALYALLTERGHTPTIGAHGIGMIGYYSQLPLVDLLGLVDPVTARLPVPAVRGRPGHEKAATWEHVRARGTVLSQHPLVGPLEGITRLRAPEHRVLRRWHVVRWNEEVARLREAVPELGIPDVEGELRRGSRRAGDEPPERARHALTLIERVWPEADASIRERFEAAADR